jgi:hypothetical protein
MVRAVSDRVCTGRKAALLAWCTSVAVIKTASALTASWTPRRRLSVELALDGNVMDVLSIGSRTRTAISSSIATPVCSTRASGTRAFRYRWSLLSALLVSVLARLRGRAGVGAGGDVEQVEDLALQVGQLGVEIQKGAALLE